MKQVSISTCIQERRILNGYTQEELARRIGVSKAAVSKWECGQSMPDIALLPKLASLFSVTIDELLGYEPQASTEKKAEVRSRLIELLDEDVGTALGFADEQSALYWSDPELLRVISMTLWAKAAEQSCAGQGGAFSWDAGLVEFVERLLGRSLQLDPDSASAEVDLQTLCMLLASTGREGRAAELIERKVARKPNTAAVTLAGIYLRAGDSERGASALKRQLLISLLEVASCAQTLAGFQELGVEDLRQLVLLAEGLRKPWGLSSILPTLVPLVRYELAARLASSGQLDQALDELEAFARGMSECCEAVEGAQNPLFFSDLSELLWEEGGAEMSAARGAACASLRSSLLGRLSTDERWGSLRGDARFELIARSLEVGRECDGRN